MIREHNPPFHPAAISPPARTPSPPRCSYYFVSGYSALVNIDKKLHRCKEKERFPVAVRRVVHRRCPHARRESALPPCDSAPSRVRPEPVADDLHQAEARIFVELRLLRRLAHPDHEPHHLAGGDTLPDAPRGF